MYSGQKYLFKPVIGCFRRTSPTSAIITSFQVGCPIRKFLDQSLFSAPQDLSQSITSFIASYCQGIHQTPFSRLIRSRKSKTRKSCGHHAGSCDAVFSWIRSILSRLACARLVRSGRTWLVYLTWTTTVRFGPGYRHRVEETPLVQTFPLRGTRPRSPHTRGNQTVLICISLYDVNHPKDRMRKCSVLHLRIRSL